MLRSVVGLAAMVAMSTGHATAAEPSSFIFESEAGAEPVGALSGDWPSVRVREFDGELQILASGQGAINIHVPGAPIGEGAHTRSAVLIYRGIGCWDDQALLDITRLERDSDGRISEFDGAVEHRCDRSPDKTFRAKVHYVR